MKAPPLLIGLALLFWGWQTGLTPLAVIVLIILEGSRITTFRLELEAKDYYRLWDLCGIIFIAVIFYTYFEGEPNGIFLPAIKWLPIIFLPIMVAQSYGSLNKIEIGVFFLMLRRKEADRTSGRAINITYPYLVLIITAASAANVRDIWFFAALCFFVVWSLWTVRPQRFSVALWGGLLIVAIGSGYFGGMGLREVQSAIDEKVLEWYARYIQNQFDPSRASTAIGEIGRLKTFNYILFHMERVGGGRSPMLIQRSSYNIYRNSFWIAHKAPYKQIEAEADGLSWELSPNSKETEAIIIYSDFGDGNAVLTLPNNAEAIERLPATAMRKNRMGAVIIEGWPGFAGYKIKLGQTGSINGSPDDIDLQIPKNLDKTLGDITKRLGFESKSPKEILRDLSIYFAQDYSYSLDLESGRFGDVPLVDFLTRTKSGHCEYFATAATLLLRKAGIPARYTVGYWAGEYSQFENKFIVRSRDAHAWTMAYVDGRWINLDTTPSSWVEIDSQNGSLFEPVGDLFSYINLLFNQWRSSDDDTIEKYGLYVVIPLIVFLAWRVMFKPKIVTRRKHEAINKAEVAAIGAESGFYMIERKLNEQGYYRRPYETQKKWIARLQQEGALAGREDELPNALNLHYTHRFDPMGLGEKERVELTHTARKWAEMSGG